MKNLLDQVKHWAKISPDKIMVIDGDVTMTYAEVFDRARRFAGGLIKLGIKKTSRVAAIMYNNYRYYDLYYGVSAGGYVFVPLNFRLAGSEIAYQINDSGTQIVIMAPEFEEIISRIKSSLKTVKHFVYIGEKSPFPGAVPYESLFDSEPCEVDGSKDDLFGIYYTGGTTGLAKGVMLSHRNIISNAYNFTVQIGLNRSQVAFHSAPMFHIADGGINFATSLVGGSHVLAKIFDPVPVFEIIQKQRPTFALWVPTMLNAMVNHPDIEKYDLSSINLIVYGASPISSTLIKKAIKIFKCDFIQAYGMTEASPVVSVLMPEDHRKAINDPDAGALLKSCGKQIVGVEVKVVDVDGNDVKVGEVGEIIVRGDTIMHGYWKKPAETEAALIDGWYWTKDLAQIDENAYLYIVDRAKDMIISGAENVYSIEVECVLSKHLAVLEAAVVGVPDQKWGEAVKGVVALKNGMFTTEEELIRFCKQQIAYFKTPKSIDFVDSLPKSGAGKILKRTLRDNYWKGKDRFVH